MAWAHNDSVYCEMVNGSEIKRECYVNLVSATNNPKYCLKTGIIAPACYLHWIFNRYYKVFEAISGAFRVFLANFLAGIAIYLLFLRKYGKQIVRALFISNIVSTLAIFILINLGFMSEVTEMEAINYLILALMLSAQGILCFIINIIEDIRGGGGECVYSGSMLNPLALLVLSLPLILQLLTLCYITRKTLGLRKAILYGIIINIVTLVILILLMMFFTSRILY
jgi:hypothetical protein